MSQTNPHCAQLLSDTLETLVNNGVVPARLVRREFVFYLFSFFVLLLAPFPLSLSPFLSVSFSVSLSLSLRAVCEVVLSEISTNNLMTWRQGLSLVNSIIPCVDYKVRERERVRINNYIHFSKGCRDVMKLLLDKFDSFPRSIPERLMPAIHSGRKVSILKYTRVYYHYECMYSLLGNTRRVY